MMAYENFDNVEEFKSIISVDQRMNLAIELNSAILTGFNKFPKPAVDQFINHLSIITNFVNEKVEGFGGLIDSDHWI
ncbi:hypothetical protein GJ496_006369 [Pomphorhynchus laevis]|nr:hypothetical protein GJ496_006369 [Pomphorhynchus laevis]